LPNGQDIAYSFCFTGAETEIHKIKDDGKISKANKPQSPRSEANSYHLPPSLPPPPSFSLPTTFKEVLRLENQGFEKEPKWLQVKNMASMTGTYF
jgi:hypothetical protein